MERDRQAVLPEIFNPLGFTEKFRTCGDQKVLAVMGIDVAREKALDRPGHLPVEAVDKYGFKYGPFKDDVGLARRRGGCASRRGCRALGLLLSAAFPGRILCWRGTGNWHQSLWLEWLQQLSELRSSRFRRCRSQRSQSTLMRWRGLGRLA